MNDRTSLSDQPLAVEFVNTRRSPSDQADLIGDYERLEAWLGGGSPQSLPSRRLLFAEAHRLREVVGDVLHALEGGRPPDDRSLRGLDRLLGDTSLRPRLELSEGAPNGVRFSLENPRADGWARLEEITMDTARLAATARRERLRRCAAPECPRWFIDTSKGGRRKWCSMKTCGNRNKVARFRSRQS